MAERGYCKGCLSRCRGCGGGEDCRCPMSMHEGAYKPFGSSLLESLFPSAERRPALVRSDPIAKRLREIAERLNDYAAGEYGRVDEVPSRAASELNQLARELEADS